MIRIFIFKHKKDRCSGTDPEVRFITLTFRGRHQIFFFLLFFGNFNQIIIHSEHKAVRDPPRIEWLFIAILM